MYLIVEPEMTRVASYTIPVQAPLIVETGTARAVERHRHQEVEVVN